MKSTRFMQLAGGLLASGMVVALSGCGAPTPVAAPPPRSITISDGIQSQPNYFLPMLPAQYCTGTNGGFSGEVYRPLLWVTRHDTINYARSIATRITVSHHDEMFTLHIGSRFHWSDGRPVTAQDALFSYNIVRAASQPNSPWLYCNTGIGGLPALWGSAHAPNPSTLVVTTTRPVNPVWFELNGLGQLYPLPASVWNRYPKNLPQELAWYIQTASNLQSPQLRIVDGAYRYGPLVDNEYATLLANPHYTGPTKPTIQKVTLLYETSNANQFAQLLKGTLDTASIPSSYYDARSGLVAKGYKIAPYPYIWAFQYIVLNMWPQSPVASLFDRAYIRRALQLGINQPGMVKLASGLAYTERGPVPSVPSNPFADPTLPVLKFNPSQGKALLEAHGWHLVHNVMTRGSTKLTFQMLYPPGTTWLTDSLQLMQAAWAQEGIRVSLVASTDALTLLTTPSDHAKWEMVPFNWGYQPDFFPDGGGLFRPGSSVNFGGYSNPTTTRLIDATYAPGTTAQVVQRMYAYERAVNAQLPVLFFPENTNYAATKAWLHGVNNLNSVQGLPYYNHWTTSSPS